MGLVLALLLSTAAADVQFCNFGPDDVREFFKRYEIESTDMRSFLIIHPDGSNPINLLAYFEQKQIIVRLNSQMVFNPNQTIVFQWPEVKRLFFEISRTGLSPSNLAELLKYDLGQTP